MINRTIAFDPPIALAVGSLVSSATDAGAVDGRVRSACAGDYLTFAVSTTLTGQVPAAACAPTGRSCPSSCINALVAGGEVSKREVSRRAASK